jgi:hypothetical protein
MWQRTSPYSVAFTTFDSVSETLEFDRAGSTNAFSGFDGNLSGFWVGVIFGPKDFRDAFTTDTSDTIYRLCQFAVGQVLS